MSGLRFLAALAVPLLLASALAWAQSDQGDESLPDLNPGEGWIALETKARTGLRARAWSDPAAGCHLVLFTMPAAKTAGLEQMATTFAKALKKASITTETGGENSDDTQLRLSGQDLNGRARLDLSSGEQKQASLLACYWNQREPKQCRAICERSLAAYSF